MLTEAVTSEMVADTPVGMLLSGGVDSSAVTSIAARTHGNGPALQTFAIDYADNDVNYSSSSLHRSRDTPWAELVARFAGTHHSTHYVTNGELTAAHGDCLRAMGQPSMALGNVSLLLLFRHIRDNAVPVVLGGEGADEAFAGYSWWHDIHDVRHNGWPWHRTYRRSDALLRADLRREADAYVADTYSTAIAQVPHFPRETTSEHRMRESTWLTYQYYLAFLLHRLDRLSMAAGVEARVPFCDHRLVQYAWNIPVGMKGGSRMEKNLLRQAVAPFLPNGVAWRPKSGYPAALTEGYRRSLYDQAVELLASPDEPMWQLLDPTAVRRLLRPHLTSADWTAALQLGYALETNAWLKMLSIRVVA